MIQTSTYFALIAEYGTAELELEKISQKYFGLAPAEAKRRASMNRLPVTAFRAGTQKAPWLVAAVDLAKLLDDARIRAQREWERSQTESPPN